MKISFLILNIFLCLMIFACGDDETTLVEPSPEPAKTYYVGTLEGNTDGVYSVAFSPDGSALASGGIRRW